MTLSIEERCGPYVAKQRAEIRELAFFHLRKLQNMQRYPHDRAIEMIQDWIANLNGAQ